MQEISQDIIRQLESRGAAPIPRWRFILVRSAFWLLSAASVAVGSVAFSVGWYVFFDNDGLRVSFANLFQVIPYVWIVVLVLFILCAYWGFRQTRKGYRYSASVVVTLIVAASIVGGLVFDTFDIGPTVHKFLLSHTSFYDALIYSSEDISD